MGMFDQIRCEYPLPGEQHPAFKGVNTYQTKDLDCVMDTFVLTASGAIEPDPFKGRKGTINFYESNCIGSGPGGLYTKNGEDMVSVEYQAVFSGGQVQSIEQTEFETSPAVKPIREIHPAQSAEEIAERKRRQSEKLIGKTIHILRGGTASEVYSAKVIADGPREIVVETPERQSGHGFEVIDRGFRDHIYWDTEAEALQNRQNRKDDWERRKQAELAQKKPTGSTQESASPSPE